MTKRARKPTVMIGQTASHLKSFLTRDSSTKSGWALWFCRGVGKCPKGPVHRQLAKQRCADCVRGEEGEPVEHLMERIERGNG